MKSGVKKSICLAVVVLGLAGCSKVSSHLFINQREKESSTSWEMTYEKFNGYSQRTIQIEEAPRAFVVDVDTEDGTLNVELTKDDQEILTTHEAASVEIKESGTYTLRVEGDDHKGGFTIHWDE